MPKTRLKRNENLIYLTVWLLAMLLYLLHAAGENGRTEFLTGHDFVRMINAIGPYLLLFLVNNYLLIPRLLNRRRGWLYVIAVTALLLLLGIYQYFNFLEEHVRRHAMMSPAPPAPFVHGPNRWIPMPLVDDFVYSILTIGANLTVYLMFRQADYDIERQRIIAAGSESRIEQLKSQISPHFYMNMLNSIHGLIELNPAKAQEMVFDMSQLMRYMLYESEHQHIPLLSEVKFLQDYMRIMRQRYPADKVKITSTFPDPDEMTGVEIPPLLFLVFIENAFKHGVSYRKTSYVDVRIYRTDNELIFNCENSISDESGNASSKGIGLRNIAQRLHLLYGNDAKMKVEQSSEAYHVNLTIPLKQ